MGTVSYLSECGVYSGAHLCSLSVLSGAFIMYVPSRSFDEPIGLEIAVDDEVTYKLPRYSFYMIPSLAQYRYYYYSYLGLFSLICTSWPISPSTFYFMCAILYVFLLLELSYLVGL